MPKTKNRIQREGRFGRFKARGALRMLSRKVPGGRTVIQFKKRKPKSAKCAVCGTALSGTPRARPHKMMNLPKTMKRPERPFGGVLCSKCSRNKIIAEVRK